MKKLIMMLATATCVAMSNAAVVKWGSSAMTLPSGGNAGSSVSASLYVVTQSVYENYTAYTDAAKLSDAIYKAYKDSATSFTGTSKKNAVTLTDEVEYNSGSTIYAVLLYTAKENGKDYWMGNYGKVTLGSDQDQTVSQMGQYIGGSTGSLSTATAWSSNVPEPTSAMLLLIGFCGLALKRKNA